MLVQVLTTIFTPAPAKIAASPAASPQTLTVPSAEAAAAAAPSLATAAAVDSPSAFSSAHDEFPDGGVDDGTYSTLPAESAAVAQPTETEHAVDEAMNVPPGVANAATVITDAMESAEIPLPDGDAEVTAPLSDVEPAIVGTSTAVISAATDAATTISPVTSTISTGVPGAEASVHPAAQSNVEVGVLIAPAAKATSFSAGKSQTAANTGFLHQSSSLFNAPSAVTNGMSAQADDDIDDIRKTAIAQQQQAAALRNLFKDGNDAGSNVLMLLGQNTQSGYSAEFVNTLYAQH